MARSVKKQQETAKTEEEKRQERAKNMWHGQSAKNVRHGDKNVLHFAKNEWHVQKM